MLVGLVAFVIRKAPRLSRGAAALDFLAVFSQEGRAERLPAHRAAFNLDQLRAASRQWHQLTVVRKNTAGRDATCMA